jgi:ATP-dependent Clp protease ATP-binding subunit ClpA
VLLRGPRLDEAPGPDAGAPPPIMALRVMLAQASRIAVQARAPYVGTEHLVVAAFWADYAQPLRLQGITYTQVTQQLTTLPRTEQTVDDGAIEPLTAVAVPTPAAANLADTARQLAELHPVQGDRRVSTLHHLLALSRHTAAATLLGELGISYRVLVERLAADGARLVEADDQRPEEPPLEGWEAFEVTPQEHETITGRLG